MYISGVRYTFDITYKIIYTVKHLHSMKMEQLSTLKENKYTVTYRDWKKRYLRKPCEDDHIVLLNIFISSDFSLSDKTQKDM